MRQLLITFIIVFIFCLITCYKSEAQSPFNIDKWKEYVNDLSMDETDEEALETLYNDLSSLAENPFELNNITEEQLKRLPFLTDRQISNLLIYKKRYGQMLSIYELKNVEGLDFDTLELLLPFVYINDINVDKLLINVDNLLKYGRNELYMRYDQCFQQKKGYKHVPDSILTGNPNKKYLGEPFYNSIRYSYNFDERVQLGFVAEKDGGEPLMNNYHKGYDYYSVSLLIKGQKWLKALVAGDYKIAFGQGLVVSNDYSPSRSAILSHAERRNNGFRRHYSTNEYDFFRGIGGSFNVGKLDLNVFYSSRNLSGSTDSLLITSIKTDGLHRLHRDWDKRNRIGMLVFGGNARYVTPDFTLGFTALNYSFNGKRYEPEAKPYNVYYFRGKENTDMSVDYMFKKGKVKFYGETAVSSNKAIATLNGLLIQPKSYASFLVLYRNYNKGYQAFFSNSFSQNSSPQNEEGVYLGMQLSPAAYWRLSAYADIFRFPWMKYGVDAPSSGKEYMIQAEYNKERNYSFSFRYRYKQTEKNITSDRNIYIGEFYRHRFRFQLNHTSNEWKLRTSLDGVGHSSESGGLTKGWMIGQNIFFQPEKRKLKGDIFLAYFDTDNSSVTISSFEPTPLYVYYRPLFYGQGLRFACSLHYDIFRNLMMSLKLTTTHYFDRNKIGTELEEIEGSDKTDANIILRWKF